MNTCFHCGQILEVEEVDANPFVTNPVYGGIWFRAYGNFGSTVFDPVPPNKGGECLQIMICDECIKKMKERVVRIHNIKNVTTADCEEFSLKQRT